MRRWVSGVVLGVLALAPIAPSPAQTLAERPQRSIAKTVNNMRLREKIGQLVMFKPSGRSLSATESELIDRHYLGGLILFADNYSNKTQLANLTAQIQRVVRKSTRFRIGALISVDQEGGVVKRFPDMPPGYSAPELGRRDDKQLTFGQGKATGKALRDHGVNVNLAPVADLDLPPERVMRARAFGSNRYLVGRHVKAFTQGMQRRHRVGATLKHFPGLGGATQNSDDGRAYVHRSRWELRNIDALPFRRAIDAGARLVMLSHAIYPNDGGDVPASLNRSIATKRLRKGFDFKGVAISDDMGAIAWRFGGDVVRSCPKTIRAGVDIALLVRDVHTAAACAQKIYEAVRQGDISSRRIDQATTRVLELKAWLGIGPR